jgi:hypothetical protein
VPSLTPTVGRATAWTRLLSLVLSLTVLLLAVAPVAATSIQTDLWVYAQGDTVNVSGDGFGPAENVQIVTTDPYGVVVDDGITTSDPSGYIAYSFVLNSDVPGIYDVVATGLSSGLTASTQFDPAVNLQLFGSDALQHGATPGQGFGNIPQGTAVAFNATANLSTADDGTSVSWAVAQISGPSAVLTTASGTFTNPANVPGPGGNSPCCTGAPATVGVSVATGALTVGTTYVVRLQITGTSASPTNSPINPQDLFFNFTVVAGGKAPGSVIINNIPASAVYGDSFTPTFTKLGDGTASATSSTPSTCSISSGVVSFDGVGTCTLQASVTEGTNHLAANGPNQSFTIDQRPVTVTVDAGQQKIYGDSDPLAFTYSITSGSLAFSDSFSGALSRLSGEDVGTYAIVQNTLSLGPNYDLGFIGDDFTINPAHLTVTADDQVRLYGEANPALTYTISGFANGETDAVVSGSADCSTTADATTAVADSPVDIDCTAGSLSAANYDFPAANFVSGSLTINPAHLTVTADDQVRLYGEANPALTYTISGFANGEDDSVVSGSADCSTTAILTSPVSGNPYPITCTAGSLAAANYDFPAANFVAGELTINPAHLTVTADDKTKVLNSANPPLTYTISGFVNGETDAVVSGEADCSTTAILTSPVSGNPYPITCTVGSLSAANYDFPAANFVPGELIIQYAALGTICLGSPGHQILQPINFDGTSVFKKGSTVPAKFRVCDANGNSIGTAGLVTSFRLIGTLSGTFCPVDEAVDSTTPDTAFRWSATDQLWIYNINTKNLQANKTYTYEIKLNDGTSITFMFGLK